MKLYYRQDGALNILLIPLIMSAVMLFAAIGFGAWAYSSRQDYKNNTDQKIEAAVEVAKERTKTEKDNEFLEREKQPLKDYTSPGQFGGFTVLYPKTWSALSDEQADQLTLMMQPDVVSSNKQTAFALKVEVLSTSYEVAVRGHDSDIRTGKSRAATYVLPKVPGVVGLRIDGQVSPNKTGAVVYLPLRDKTLRIATESPERVADFNNIILPNFVFSP